MAIIILNWNNASDTIECINSVFRAEMPVNSVVFLVDNGSSDQSVSQIMQWLQRKQVTFDHYKRTVKGIFQPIVQSEKPRLCMLENGENLGFAKGNNVAIRFVLNEFAVDFQYYLLLNNDTLVLPKSIVKLLEAAENYPEFLTWTPLIIYESDRERVWNAGGYIDNYGGRKYIAHKKPRVSLPQTGIRQITFITGCALLAEKSIWERNLFLNEDFFFGEEDYYFSKQMKHLGIKMAVAFESVIYHKVGTSSNYVSPKSQLPLLFIHFMNRIVDMKKWMNPLTFALWKLGFVLHAVFNTWWKRWYSFSAMWKFTRLLVKHSRGKTCVTREDFFGAGKLFINEKYNSG